MDNSLHMVRSLRRVASLLRSDESSDLQEALGLVRYALPCELSLLATAEGNGFRVLHRAGDPHRGPAQGARLLSLEPGSWDAVREMDWLGQPTLAAPLPDAAGPLGLLLLQRRRGQPDWTSTEKELALHLGEVFAAGLGRQVERNRAALETQRRERAEREARALAGLAEQHLADPLATLARLATWVEEEAQDSLGPSARERLEALRLRAAEMRGVAEALGGFARAGLDAASWVPVELERLVKNCSRRTGLPAGFQVEVLGSCHAVAPRAALEEALTALIDNAARHHPHPEEGRLRITFKGQERLSTLHVEDDGEGWSREEWAEALRPFRTLERTPRPGLGLGLPRAQRAVESAGGRLQRIESCWGGAGLALVFNPSPTPQHRKAVPVETAAVPQLA